jgi:peptidoglycan-associated lipoprotein
MKEFFHDEWEITMKGDHMKKLKNFTAKVEGMGLLSICLVGLFMSGCSSRLHTTVMSSTEPEPVAPVVEQKAHIPDETPRVEPKIAGIPRMDIPVEEPARPVIRPSGPAEIFSAPREEVTESPIPPVSETPFEPLMDLDSLSPLSATPDQDSPQVSGIPPIDIEPELPAFPSMPQVGTAPDQQPDQELPQVADVAPIDIEPELPAIPYLPDTGPSAQDLVSEMDSEQMDGIHRTPTPEAPDDGKRGEIPPSIDIAKVMPPEPEEMVKTVLKPLEDVFFDYDRFSLRQDALPVLKENAQSLVVGLSDKNIIIEGHCDERGTSSYNMVLGERRAHAVKEYLVNLGVPGDRLQTISFGKERPFCTDQHEDCWKENRRGHFVVK